MQILSQPALTRNGNLYRKTNKMATTGAVLAGGLTAAKEIKGILSDTTPVSKSTRAIQFGAVALLTFLSAGLGKLFGSVLDNQTNKNREEQTDRLSAVLANMQEVAQVEPETVDECDCEECTSDDIQTECDCEECAQEEEAVPECDCEECQAEKEEE